MNKRQATELAFAIVLVLVNPLFLIISIPITGLFIADCLLFKSKKKKNKEKEKEIPIEEENNIEQIKACVEEIEEKNKEDLKYRKKVDLRQFKNRNDVTKEEVAEYLWFHYMWEGFHEKIIICEEIKKVSNINDEDIKWILNEHYNHKSKKGEKGNGCWIRDYEIKKIMEYSIKKERERNKNFQEWENKENNLIKGFKELEEINEYIKDKKMDEKYKYIYYYEDWLKEKGYI